MHGSSRAALRLLIGSVVAFAIFLLVQPISTAQQFPPSLFSGLHWRLIGPFRGGRSNAVTGVPGEPSTFYFGSVGGGVWKSGNSGRTWTPIFDSQPVPSIGAIAVAPSNPKVLYVGTGESDMRSQISYGNGMYKSTDAGKTWTHIGLEDSQHIPRLAIDYWRSIFGANYDPLTELGTSTKHIDPRLGVAEPSLSRFDPTG